MCPSDTSPEAWRVFLELVRRATPGERMKRALEVSETVRAFAEAGMRARHPHADDREIFLRMAQLYLGDNLARRVYGSPVDGPKNQRP
ncbi:MAG: hypothetical protein P4L56_25085 [Candidatus Sulfopaludibacter sp.]|nr:hypothetical protein [Candidatus Sulfopaludibacter sp.]